MIEILSNGGLNSVQDLGRHQHLGQGVSPSGAMDVPALSVANRMVGNATEAAGIEICIFPFRVRFLQETAFACTGAIANMSLPGKTLPSWWAGLAQPDDVLVIGAPSAGARAYLAIAGGIDVPVVLGARATDLKSGFGGLQGRGLKKGDRLPLGRPAGAADNFAPRCFGVVPRMRETFVAELQSGVVRVRVLAGAEFPEFTDESAAALTSTEFTLTAESNRQGAKLQGLSLNTRRPLELLSHGIVPGTIQVPPSGQPIIQLAEANTCGGYPKIATVIGADLWRIGQVRPGQRIRFERVDHETAVCAKRQVQAELARIEHGIALAPGGRA